VARALAALGAVLIVAGGGAIGYAVTREAVGGMTPAASAAMTRAASALDGDIKAARGAVRERAATLSKLQAVRAVVVTDAETAKDAFEKGELAFSPGTGEVIELGQVKGDRAAPFLVQPPGAMSPSRNGVPGSYAELAGDQLVITEVAAVEPSSDAIVEGVRVRGYVMVSRPLDLAPSIANLEAAELAGRVDVGGKVRVIGNPPADGPTQVQPLSEAGAQLVIAVPPAKRVRPMGVLGGGAGAAVLGLVLVAAGMLRKRTPAGAVAAEPVSPNAPTQLSAPFAAGTSASDPASSTTHLANRDLGAGSGPARRDRDLVAGSGTTIGRWEVIRRLGSGGMADVYLAKAKGEAGFEKLVAIKVMHQHLARNPRAVDHFLDEARLAARITHPNVVAIQDLGKIGEDYVIVMDYVEGVDLERLLASARDGARLVPVEVGLGILSRICDGLTAAHRATAPDGTPLGIIHRDVKSANVLVSRQGGVKVVDFGIAKASAQAHVTIAGETKGTPSMMAPEQRIGEQVDVRADVYSMGAVAYEVLTGHAVNLDLAALGHLGIDNWPHLPPPTSLRANLPPELDGLLLAAMAYDRERRPADCAIFEGQLEGVMKAHGLSCNDKDIARWVETELRYLVPPFQGASGAR